MKMEDARKLAQLAGTQRVNAIIKGIEEDKKTYRIVTVIEIFICLLVLGVKKFFF